MPNGPVLHTGRPLGQKNVELIRRLLYITAAALILSIFFLGNEVLTSLPSPVNLANVNRRPAKPDYVPVEGVHRAHLPPPAPTLATQTMEPVVFSLLMWSRSSATEGALLIKSILMYNSRPTDFHIICDGDAEEMIRTRLQLITRPSQQVRVWFYELTWQAMLDRVEREGSIRTDHSAGLPGLMKLFIQEILPRNVTKVIFVDTDAFFIADPALLWNVFDTLRPQTSVVMSSHPDQNAPEWNNASRICSCVMLLDLELLRKARLMNSDVYAKINPSNPGEALSTAAFRAMYGLPGGDGNGRYTNVRLGDQGYWWAIVDHYKNIFEPLSYDFEVTSCVMDTYNTGLGSDTITEEEERSHQIHVKDTPQEGKTILPKLVHFNCLHDEYMQWPGWNDPNDSLNIRWGPALKYHDGYKWIWLNTGNKEKRKYQVEIYSNDKVVFADEEALRLHLHMNRHKNH